MNDWIFIMAVIAVMMIGLVIFAIRKNKSLMEIRTKHPGYPKGHWMEQGMAIGIAIGAGVGVALDNVAIGVGIGVAIGAAMGSGMEKQHEGEIRPMVPEEAEIKKQSRMVALGLFILGFVVFILFFLSQR